MSDALAKVMLLFLLGMPFVFVAALAREVAVERNDARLGWRTFAVMTGVLGLNLLWAWWVGETYASQKMFTAASLSFAWVIPRSIFIVLVCWGVSRRCVGG
jgi:hypothetical protein